MEKAGVLVPQHLAADARRFEYQHRIQQQRLGEVNAGGNPGQTRLAGKSVKYRVEIVQGMADFIDQMELVLTQCAVRATRESQAAGAANFSSTRNPSRRKSLSCCAFSMNPLYG